MKGITNAFWPEPGIVTVRFIEPEDAPPRYQPFGYALYLGKYYVQNAISDEEFVDADTNYNKRDITNLMYHLFGNAETPLWTQSPTPLEVDHSHVFVLVLRTLQYKSNMMGMRDLL